MYLYLGLKKKYIALEESHSVSTLLICTARQKLTDGKEGTGPVVVLHQYGDFLILVVNNFDTENIIVQLAHIFRVLFCKQDFFLLSKETA